MSHLDTELKILKTETIEMWKLVGLQMEKTYEALTTFDRDLAREVRANENTISLTGKAIK